MNKIIRLFAKYFSFIIVIFSSFAHAEDGLKDIVAKVDDGNIYQHEINDYIKGLPNEANNIPRIKLESMVLNEIIRVKLFRSKT